MTVTSNDDFLGPVPIDDGEIDPRSELPPAEMLSLDQIATNVDILKAGAPYLTEVDGLINELASSGMDPVYIVDQGLGALNARQVAQFSQQLSLMSPSRQRGLYAMLTPTQQEQLASATGYYPPTPQQEVPWWAGPVSTGLSWANTVNPFRLLPSAVKDPVKSGASWLLEGMVEVGDEPSHLYRTGRQLSGWQQAIGAVAATGATLAASRFLRNPNATNALARFVQGGGRFRALSVAGSAATAGFAGGTFLSTLPSGTSDYWRAYQATDNGDRLFDPDVIERQQEILGSDRYFSLAANLASYTTPYKIAEEFAAMRDNLREGRELNIQQLSNSVYEVASEYAEPGTEEHQIIVGELLTLLDEPVFRNAVVELAQSKTSIGRDAFGWIPGIGDELSGVADALYLIAVDPFMLAGPVARTARWMRYGVQSNRLVGSNPIARLANLYASGDKRIVGWVDDTITAINEQSLRLMPPNVRAVFDPARAFMVRNNLDEMTTKDFFTFLEETNTITSAFTGVGTRKGFSPIVFKPMRTNSFSGRLRQNLLGFREGVNEAWNNRTIRKMLDESGEVDIVELLALNIDEFGDTTKFLDSDDLQAALAKNILEAQTEQGIRSGEAGRLGYLLGRSLTPINYATRGKLGKILSTTTRMAQTKGYVNPDNIGELSQMVESVGAVFNMPQWFIDGYLTTFLQTANAAQRRILIRNFYDRIFDITGLKHSPAGEELYKRFVLARTNAYQIGDGSLSGYAQSAQDAYRANRAAMPGQLAENIAVPNTRAMVEARRLDRFYSRLGIFKEGDIVNASLINTYARAQKASNRANGFWRVAAVMRFGFIPRAVGEEAIAAGLRGEFGTWGASAAARGRTKYDEFTRVIEKRNRVGYAQLTDAERELLAFENGRFVYQHLSHLYPFIRIADSMRAGRFVNSYIDAYEAWFRKVVDTGNPGILGQQLLKWFNINNADDVGNNPLFAQMLLGRKDSWTRAKLLGVSNGLKHTADVWYKKMHGASIMRAVGAQSTGRIADTRQVIGLNTVSSMEDGMPVPLFQSANQYDTVLISDSRARDGLHNQAFTTINDPVYGDVFDELLPRFPPSLLTGVTTPETVVDLVNDWRQIADRDTRLLLLAEIFGNDDHYQALADNLASMIRLREREIAEKSLQGLTDEVDRLLLEREQLERKLELVRTLREGGDPLQAFTTFASYDKTQQALLDLGPIGRVLKMIGDIDAPDAVSRIERGLPDDLTALKNLFARKLAPIPQDYDALELEIELGNTPWVDNLFDFVVRSEDGTELRTGDLIDPEARYTIEAKKNLTRQEVDEQELIEPPTVTVPVFGSWMLDRLKTSAQTQNVDSTLQSVRAYLGAVLAQEHQAIVAGGIKFNETSFLKAMRGEQIDDINEPLYLFRGVSDENFVNERTVRIDPDTGELILFPQQYSWNPHGLTMSLTIDPSQAMLYAQANVGATVEGDKFSGAILQIDGNAFAKAAGVDTTMDDLYASTPRGFSDVQFADTVESGLYIMGAALRETTEVGYVGPREVTEIRVPAGKWRIMSIGEYPQYIDRATQRAGRAQTVLGAPETLVSRAVEDILTKSARTLRGTTFDGQQIEVDGDIIRLAQTYYDFIVNKSLMTEVRLQMNGPASDFVIDWFLENPTLQSLIEVTEELARLEPTGQFNDLFSFFEEKFIGPNIDDYINDIVQLFNKSLVDFSDEELYLLKVLWSTYDAPLPPITSDLPRELVEESWALYERGSQLSFTGEEVINKDLDSLFNTALSRYKFNLRRSQLDADFPVGVLKNDFEYLLRLPILAYEVKQFARQIAGFATEANVSVPSLTEFADAINTLYQIENYSNLMSFTDTTLKGIVGQRLPWDQLAVGSGFTGILFDLPEPGRYATVGLRGVQTLELGAEQTHFVGSDAFETFEKVLRQRARTEMLTGPEKERIKKAERLLPDRKYLVDYEERDIIFDLYSRETQRKLGRLLTGRPFNTNYEDLFEIQIRRVDEAMPDFERDWPRGIGLLEEVTDVSQIDPDALYYMTALYYDQIQRQQTRTSIRGQVLLDALPFNTRRVLENPVGVVPTSAVVEGQQSVFAVSMQDYGLVEGFVGETLATDVNMSFQELVDQVTDKFMALPIASVAADSYLNSQTRPHLRAMLRAHVNSFLIGADRNLIARRTFNMLQAAENAPVLAVDNPRVALWLNQVLNNVQDADGPNKIVTKFVNAMDRSVPARSTSRSSSPDYLGPDARVGFDEPTGMSLETVTNVGRLYGFPERDTQGWQFIDWAAETTNTYMNKVDRFISDNELVIYKSIFNNFNEQYTVRQTVYRQIDDQLQPIEQGTVVDLSQNFYDENGQPLATADPQYFEPHYSTEADDVLWPLVGPMLMDRALTVSGDTLVINNEAASRGMPQEFGENFSRVTFSQTTDARHIPDSQLPATVDVPRVGVDVNAIQNMWWKKPASWFFDTLASPALDSIVRRPIAFHAFYARLQNAYNYFDSFLNFKDPERAFFVNDVIMAAMPPSLKARSGGTWKGIYGNSINAPTLAAEDLFNGMPQGVLERGRAGELSVNEFIAAIRRTDPANMNTAWMEPDDIDVLYFHLEELLSQLDGDVAKKFVEDLSTQVLAIREFKRVAQERAAREAMTDVLPFIDSNEFKTVFAVYLQNLLPFWYAEENFLKRYARGLANGGSFGLSELRAAQLGYMGLRTAGFIQTDSNGQDWIVYPGSGPLNEVLSQVFRFLPGTPGDVPAVWASRTNTLLPGFNDNALQPGVGFFGSVPLALGVQLFPELEPIRRGVLGDVGAQQSVWGSFVPAHVARIFDALRIDDEQLSVKLNSAMLSIMAQYLARDARDGTSIVPTANAEPIEIQKFIDRVRAEARGLVVTQGILGLFTPGTPQAVFTAEGAESVNWWLSFGVDNPADLLSDEYRAYMYAYGPEEGFMKFVEANDVTDWDTIIDPTPFVVSRSSTLSGAPVYPHEEAWEFTTDNMKFVETYPDAFAWIVPKPAFDSKFSSYAWYQTFEAGLRSRRAPDEFYEAWVWQRTAPAYFDLNDEYERMIAEFGSTVEQRQEITAAYNLDRSSLLAANPLFAEMLANKSNITVRRQRTINQLRILVNDPDAPDSPYIEPLQEFIKAFDWFRATRKQLSQDRTQRGIQRKDSFDEQWRNLATMFIMEYPELELLYISVFEPESGV